MVVLRVLTELVALVSAYGVNFPHVVGRNHSLLVRVWDKFDLEHLVTIAQFGYPVGPLKVGDQNIIAFAPLDPYLIRGAHAVTGFGYTASALGVSFLAAVVGLVGVYRLVELDHGRGVAGTTLLLLVAWPSAFFLVTGYTEPVALACITWAFLAARRSHWVTAGLLTALATADKYYVALIVVALASELWTARGDLPAWRLGVRLGYLAIPAAAFLGAWMAYCDHLTGDPLAFVGAQRAWGRSLAWPWVLVARTYRDIVHLRILDAALYSTIVELYDAVTVVALLVVAVYAYRRVRRSYGVLLLVILCAFAFETRLFGESREILTVFPFFLTLALWCERHRWLERVLLALFLTSGFYLVERFVTGSFAG